MLVFMTYNVNVITDYYTLKIFARKLFQSKRRTYNWIFVLQAFIYICSFQEAVNVQLNSTHQCHDLSDTKQRRPLHNTTDTFTIYEGVREQKREVEGLHFKLEWKFALFLKLQDFSDIGQTKTLLTVFHFFL